jgi:hypothetical protein
VLFFPEQDEDEDDEDYTENLDTWECFDGCTRKTTTRDVSGIVSYAPDMRSRRAIPAHCEKNLRGSGWYPEKATTTVGEARLS